MDKWKDTELAKMKVGGNDKARKFLESQPDYSSTMPISQKYSTRAAELWRDKVKCESEGRPWDPSKAKASSSSMYRAKENRSSPALLQGHDKPSTNMSQGGHSRDTSTNNSYSSNSYNDINNKTSYNGGSNNSGGFSNSTGGYGNSSGGYNSSSGYNSSGGYNSSEVYTYGGNTQLQARDQFLANKMMENQSRSDNLPPSQGGKYVGFGSTPAPQPQQSSNEYMDTLSYWGSALATGATSLARAAGEKAVQVNENYIKPTAAKVADPAFQANVKQSLSHMSTRAAQLGSQGATLIASYSEKGWNSMNDKMGNRGYSYGNSVSNNSYSNTSGFGSGGGGGGYQTDTLNDPNSLSSNMSNMSVNDSYSASFSPGNAPYNSQVTNRSNTSQDIFGVEPKKQEAPADLDEWLNDGWDEDWKTESKPRSRRKKAGGKGD